MNAFVTNVSLVIAISVPVTVGFAQNQPAQSATTLPGSPPEKASSELVTSFQTLVDTLKADGAPHKVPDGKPIVLIPTAQAPIDGVMAIRWSAQEGIVHFMQSMGITIAPERLVAAYEAIGRLNHGLPVGGLGIVSESNEVYFRMTVPIAPRGGLTAEEIRAYFRFALRQAAETHPVMKALEEGKVDAADVIKYYVASRMAARKQPVGRFQRSMGGTNWELIFTGTGNVALLRDGQPVVETSSQFQGNRVTFLDRGGEMAVKGAGTYIWSADEKQISFKAVDEPAENRKGLLMSGPWERIAPAATEK